VIEHAPRKIMAIAALLVTLSLTVLGCSSESDRLVQQALSDVEQWERVEVAQVLAQEPDAVEALITALENEDPEIRRRAALTLAFMEGNSQAMEASLGFFVLRLDDPDLLARQEAASVVARLLDGLGQSGMETLMNSLGQEATVKLMAVLEYAREPVRTQIVLILADAGDWRMRELLSDIAQYGDDEESRAAAAEALFQIHITTLSAGSSEQQRDAAWGLADLGDHRAVEPLIAALQEADGAVRGAAAQALGVLGDPAAFDPLVAALQDPDGAVRIDAAQALGVLGDPAAFEPLVAALSDEDAGVRHYGAVALGGLNDPRAVEPLMISLGDESAHVRDGALKGLRQIDSLNEEDLVARLMSMLGSAVWDVPRYAVCSLILIGRPSTEEALIDILRASRDKDMAVIYLNSGNTALEEAARQWARLNGYQVASLPATTSSVKWGGG